MNTQAIITFLKYMFEASKTTLAVFILTLVFGLTLGLLVALGRMSKLKIVSIPIRIYQLIMRGTPLILQLMFFYYGPYYLFHISLLRFTAGILAFSLNYAAYFAEIYRGGIESIPIGQNEAAQVLGFSKLQTFFKIVLPQVVKRILPPMSNEFMTLVKDTSLIQVIGVAEIYQLATKTMAREFTVVPLLIAGVFYLIINIVVEQCFNIGEKRLGYYK